MKKCESTECESAKVTGRGVRASAFTLALSHSRTFALPLP